MYKINVIWEKFKNGDKNAFAVIYNQHVDILFRYGIKLSDNKEMVLDAIQEVFLDLYLKREKNQTNPENLKFYLLLAVKRNIIKKIKKAKKIISSHSLNFDYIFEPDYSIEDKIIEEEQTHLLNKRIKKALKMLPPKQKEILYLRFNESLDYKEIAQILEITIESVRKQVYRGIKTIREAMEKESFIFFTLLARL